MSFKLDKDEYHLSQAARLLDVSTGTIWNWVQAGTLQPSRTSAGSTGQTHYAFTRKDLLRHVKTQYETAVKRIKEGL